MKNDEILLLQLWDASGKLIAEDGEINKFPNSFHLKITENFREQGLHNVYRKTDEGAVRLVVEEKHSLFQGTKNVARMCVIYLSLIPKLKKIERSHRQHFDSIIKRFAHNLIQFQARFKGNFTRLISDTARARPYSEFQEEVRRRIEANTSSAANDVCQMSHRAVDLDAQIDTLRIISGYADLTAPPSPISVNLQKTIFRLTNPFIDELKKKNVTIDIRIPSPTSGPEKVLVVPDLLNAALWQFFDNVSKYVLENTTVEVLGDLKRRPQKLEFIMKSVCIDEDETDLIFLEGKKGKHSANKAGNGIGLYVVKKALLLMGARIYVVNEGFCENYKEVKYCKHRFVIEFNR